MLSILWQSVCEKGESEDERKYKAVIVKHGIRIGGTILKEKKR